MHTLPSQYAPALPSEGYLKTKALLQAPFTHEAAFILGVAHASNNIPAPLKKQWFMFLRYYLPHLHKADMLASPQYEECVATLIDAGNWAWTFAELEPRLVEKARREAPKEIWEEIYVLGTMNEWKWKMPDLEE